jgi:hypothetical protein
LADASKNTIKGEINQRREERHGSSFVQAPNCFARFCPSSTETSYEPKQITENDDFKGKKLTLSDSKSLLFPTKQIYKSREEQ